MLSKNYNNLLFKETYFADFNKSLELVYSKILNCWVLLDGF